MVFVSFFCGGDLHCRNSAKGVIANDRLTGAVDGVAGIAAEGVVMARQVEVVLPLVGAVTVDIVGVEVRDDIGGCRFGHVADAVIRHRDGRGRIRVGRRDELTGCVVSIVSDDTARPGAAGELAVGRVGVGRALPVGVDLVRHAARGFVIEPARRVTDAGGEVAVGRHRRLVAVFVVRVVDGVGRTALGEDTAFGVVPVDLAVQVHVGDGQVSFTKRIIAKIGVGQRCRCKFSSSE